MTPAVFALALAAAVALPGCSSVAAAPPAHRIIFDTDFALPPQDDGLALALALRSPELEILGITTVAGNYNVQRANADALRMLEIVHREDIGVYGGAARPLVHRKDEYAMSHYGKWWSDDPPPAPPGGFATKVLEKESAVDFIRRTVAARPGEIEIVAVGPLTNVAEAIRRGPEFAKAVKRLIIMGGAIDSLPDGAGNITPEAEFNFWVDPEAAREVIRSTIPIELSPLNASRKTKLTKRWYDALVARETPITALIRTQMGPLFEQPDFSVHMYDELAVASVVDSTLVRTKALVVDVETTHDARYGKSVVAQDRTADGRAARPIDVQYDVDFSRFIQLFVDRVGGAPAAKP